jgi:hypothetical protein
MADLPGAEDFLCLRSERLYYGTNLLANLWREKEHASGLGGLHLRAPTARFFVASIPAIAKRRVISARDSNSLGNALSAASRKRPTPRPLSSVSH